MIITIENLLEKYAGYSDPYGKIRRLVQEKKLFQIKRGLYCDEGNVSGAYLAASIYAPSYLSFNYALSYHGLIPEAVYGFTSATTEKRKKKVFENDFGTFSFQDVPLEVYPFGIEIKEENGYSFLIANKEKALCDKLYEMPIIKTKRELENLLFVDMRIDKDAFEKLNNEDILFLAPKYHSTNLNLLARYISNE